jgi:hypothetical protein
MIGGFNIATLIEFDVVGLWEAIEAQRKRRDLSLLWLRSLFIDGASTRFRVSDKREAFWNGGCPLRS